jgi:hypothetical protein
MLNRTLSSGSEALDARRAVAADLRNALREIPPTPFDWANFDIEEALRGSGADGNTSNLPLTALARLLCSAPARSPELRALWNECVVTASFAVRLAPVLNADAGVSGIAGLLHRLGDLLTLRALGTAEHAARARLDAAGKADLCAEHAAEQLDRAVRAWGIPPRAAAVAAEWRRLREFPSAAAEATAVYLARLFAIEQLAPQFCAPGMIEHACEEAGLDAARISSFRSAAT